MDILVRTILVAHRHLLCKPTTRTGRDHVRQLQAALIDVTESTVSEALGILDSVASEMHPVRILHHDK